MFYPVDSLKRGGRFYLCWVADSWPLRFATITHRQLWSQDIRVICDDLLEVIINESGRPTQRFSLRLSSQLLRGLVRLYQRKVNVFLGDMCRIHANVFKNANKKWNIQEVESVKRVRRPLPQLDEQEMIQAAPENEQRIVEMIQASGNAVANIQDITLREPTEIITDMLLRPNDGFGEEHPDQPLQQLQDRTMELMLVRADVSAPPSGLDLALDVTDRSHDRTRLFAPDAHMERISDHDITMFRKSTVEDLVPEFEKDIPEIPEIPPPELPVPVPEKSPVQQVLEEPRVIVEATKEPEPVEIELEELEAAPQAKRRRLRNRLIVDKTVKINPHLFRARIENPLVELRCEDSSDDIIDIRVPPELYFRRPCHGGERIADNLGFVISRLFVRNLGVVSAQPREDREREEVLQRSHRATRSHIERIETEQEMPVAMELQVLPQQSMAEVSVNEQLLNISEAPHVPPQVEMDIADMLTQKVETLSQERKRKTQQQDAPVDNPKKQRSIGYVSFRESQIAKLSSQEAELEAHKENRPDNIPLPPTQTIEAVPAQTAEKLVSSMLQEAGLADILVQPPVVMETDVQVSQRVTSRGKSGRGSQSDGTETPLGSLDRTKVSLGDSELTTDSKRFIRDQWGTEGTMLKILRAVKTGLSPITVGTLVARGPVIADHTRIIAARCFTSILKLKQHEFILVSKDPDTLEILDIALGSKITSSQEPF